MRPEEASERPADAGPVDCRVGRMDPERARPCERGCNGCDDCTDYDDEGVTVQSKIQLMAVAKAEDASRIFELEQRCAALEEQADLDTIRMGRLTESNQKLKDLNREMFVSRCQAHMSAEAAEQDAARFRMLLQQNKHWLGVFACNPDGTPSDSLDHAELKARLDSLIAQEPAPGCKTPAGCRNNGCLGWCDEHRPDPALKPDIAALKKRLAEDQAFAAQVTGAEFECLGDPSLCTNPRGCACKEEP